MASWTSLTGGKSWDLRHDLDTEEQKHERAVKLRWVYFLADPEKSREGVMVRLVKALLCPAICIIMACGGGVNQADQVPDDNTMYYCWNQGSALYQGVGPQPHGQTKISNAPKEHLCTYGDFQRGQWHHTAKGWEAGQ